MSHLHKCKKCGSIWEHPETCSNKQSDHKCPKCGCEQWSKFHAKIVPSDTVFVFENYGKYRLQQKGI